MRAAWHDVWGCARGPAGRLAPHVRIAAGALGFATCMVAPTSTWAGALIAATAAAGWLLLCRPPIRLVRTILVLGVAVLLPFFLLTPFVTPEAGTEPFTVPLAIVGGLFVRGLCALVASVATITTLSASDLREGLVRLPVPGVISAILIQIVHQTATLAYETRRMASAISVRASSAGSRTAWRLLASLPRVWLPRIVGRADRVAAAMELRGYCEADVAGRGRARVGLADVLTLMLMAGALGIAVAVRCWRVR
jgi:energy-coupling factor transporter transmembrane protein EcfT